MESMVAGIELSLHAVGKLRGEDVAVATARWMEYKHWKGSEYWINE
jgi:transcriptional regulator GlxA family with amidase domain